MPITPHPLLVQRQDDTSPRDTLNGNPAAQNVTQFRLANGMDVVVIEDHRSPVATHMVWYRNGSTDDPAGKSGIAHFLEHLMFKGTEDFPAGHFSKLIAGFGGEENAFTSWTSTCYFQRVPVEHLYTCMRYEADRMINLVLENEDVNSERDVVLAERGMMCDANPERLLDEELHMAAFATNPGGRPVIGWRHEIEGLTRQDALEYYQRFYRPSNAILVIAGDVVPQEVIAKAEEFYGAITVDAAAYDRNLIINPPSRASRQLVFASETVHQPMLQRLYVVPAPGLADTGEAETLDILAHLLGGDQTSYLHERLVVEKQLANWVGVYYWGDALRGETRFDITASPADGVSTDQLEAALDGEIIALIRTGFTESSVIRAQKQLVARTIYEQDNTMSLARRYGSALCTGQTVQDIALWPARIEAVTPNDLLQALKTLQIRPALSGHLVSAAAA